LENRNLKFVQITGE